MENIPSDCNKKEYVQNLIKIVRDCRATKNKHMPAVCADVLTNYKEMCGSHPLLIQFENELRQTSNELGLNSCPNITRALGSSEKTKDNVDWQDSKTELDPNRVLTNEEIQRYAGFRGMLESAFKPKEEKEEVPQPPVRTTSGFLRQLDAIEFGGSQDTLKRIHQSPNSSEQPTNSFLGFGGMLTAAFGSQEKTSQHMLDKDPPKSTLFDWMKKKKDVSPIEFLGMLKDHLREARQQGKEILIVYYQELIRKLEHTLGITNPTVQRSLGFRGMLDAAFGTQHQERSLDTPNALNNTWGFLGMCEVAFNRQR